MADQNTAFHSGDTKTLTVSIVNAAGVAVNVSTATAISYKLAATPYSTALVTKSLTSGITVVTSTVSVALLPADTASLAGRYYHEMQITDASGNVSTVLSGQVMIEAELIT